MAQTGEYGVLCNSKSELTLVPRCSYGIGNGDQCQIRITSTTYKGANAVVHVHEEGYATLEHIFRQPPIYVNGIVLKNKHLLLPNDTLTVLGKNFLYRNSVLNAAELKDRMAASNASCEPFKVKTPRPSRMTLVVGTPTSKIFAKKHSPRSTVTISTPKSTPKTEPKPQRATLKASVVRISKSASKIPTKINGPKSLTRTHKLVSLVPMKGLLKTPKDTPKNTTESVSKETPKSVLKETPKSVSKKTPKSVSKETPKSVLKETSKSVLKETPKSVSKKTPKSVSKKTPNTVSKKTPKSVSKETPKSVSKKTPKFVSKNTPKSVLKKTISPKARSSRKSSLAFQQSPVDVTSSAETPISSKRRKSANAASSNSAKRSKTKQDKWFVEEMSSPHVAKNLSLFAVSPSSFDQPTASSARSSLRASLLQRSVTKKFITSRRSKHELGDWRNLSDISLAESASMEVQTSYRSVMEDGSEGGEEFFASPLSAKSNPGYFDHNTSNSDSVSVMEISSTRDDESSPRSQGTDIESPKSGRQSRLSNFEIINLSDVSLPGSAQTPRSEKKSVTPKLASNPLGRYLRGSRSVGRSASMFKKMSLLTDISVSDISLVSNDLLDKSARKSEAASDSNDSFESARKARIAGRSSDIPAKSARKSVNTVTIEDSPKTNESTRESIALKAGPTSSIESEDDARASENIASPRKSELSRKSVESRTENFRSRKTKSVTNISIGETANISGVELLEASDDNLDASVIESPTSKKMPGSARKSVSVPTTPIGSSTKLSASGRKLRNTSIKESAVFNSSARTPEISGSTKKSQSPSNDGSVKSVCGRESPLIIRSSAVPLIGLENESPSISTLDVSGRKSMTESRSRSFQLFNTSARKSQNLESSIDSCTDSVFESPVVTEKSANMSTVDSSKQRGNLKSQITSLFETPTAEITRLEKLGSSTKSRESAFESSAASEVNSTKKSRKSKQYTSALQSPSVNNSLGESWESSTRMASERKSQNLSDMPVANGSVATLGKKKKSELDLLNELTAQQNSPHIWSARSLQRKSLMPPQASKDGLGSQVSRALRSQSLGGLGSRSVLISTASTETISLPTSTTDDFNDSYLDITDSERSTVGNIITNLADSNRYSDISDAGPSVTSTSDPQHKLVVTRRRTFPAIASPPSQVKNKRLSLLMQKRSSAIKASLAIDEVLMKENVVNESSKVLSVASGGVGKKRKAVGVTPQANKKLRSDTSLAGMSATKPQQAYQFVTTKIPNTFKFNASGAGNVLSAESFLDNKILNLSSRSNILTSARKSLRSASSDATFSSVSSPGFASPLGSTQKRFANSPLKSSAHKSLLAEDECSNDENIPDVSSYSSLHTTLSSSFSFAKEVNAAPTPDVRGIRRLFEARQGTPKNNFTNVSSGKKLMVTPQTPTSPKNDLQGIQHSLPTSEVMPTPDLRGIRRLFKLNSPKNDLRDVRGVRTLLKTPKALPTPDPRGIKRMLVPSSPINDLDDLEGVKTLLRTPKSVASPDLRGIKKIFDASSPINDLTDVCGIDVLFEEHNKDNAFDALLPVKPPRTYRSKGSLQVAPVTDEPKVEYVDPGVEKWVEEQDPTLNDVAPDNNTSVECDVATTSTTRTKRKRVLFDETANSMTVKRSSRVLRKKVNTTKTTEAHNKPSILKSTEEEVESKATTQSRTKKCVAKGKVQKAATKKATKTEKELEDVETKEEIENPSPSVTKRPRRAAAKANVQTASEQTEVLPQLTTSKNQKKIESASSSTGKVDVDPTPEPVKKATRSRVAKKELEIEEPKPILTKRATRTRIVEQESQEVEDAAPAPTKKATRSRATKKEGNVVEESRPVEKMTRARTTRKEAEEVEEPKPTLSKKAMRSRKAQKEEVGEIEVPKKKSAKKATSKKQAEEAVVEETAKPRTTRSRSGATAEASSVIPTTRSTRRKK